MGRRATLLLIGDYAKIAPALRELNLGEITVLDVDGKPVGQHKVTAQ